MAALKHLPEIAQRLRDRYADFAHQNKANPLDELIFILCSVQTTEQSYQKIYRDLRASFPSYQHLADAPAEDFVPPLAHGGLQQQRAKRFRTIFDRIQERFGKLTLAPLKTWPEAECEAFLTTLPGVGKKVARCVMMYSLDMEVFPVDTHCWRIARRLGWVRRTTKDGHCSDRDMDRLQEKIPPEWRHSLHVNFISLGREICLDGRPRCHRCPLADLCPKLGARPAPRSYR